MELLSIALNCHNRQILIVGGGKVATRKVETLLPTGANITVVAPCIDESISKHASIHCLRRPFTPDDLKKQDFIFHCTPFPEIGAQIVDKKLPSQLLNDCTTKQYSDFFSQATFVIDETTVSVHSSGKCPRRTKAFKNYLQNLLKKFPYTHRT